MKVKSTLKKQALKGTVHRFYMGVQGIASNSEMLQPIWHFIVRNGRLNFFSIFPITVAPMVDFMV